ncbi:MAG: hypothetical protein ACYDCT_12545 [Dehalococcoidia bacterium]
MHPRTWPPGARLLAGSALAALAVLAAAACGGGSPSSSGPASSSATSVVAPVDGIPCESNEQLTYHIHAHLSIFVDGQAATVPAGTGIHPGRGCIFWLHTHDTSGVIHVEAPSQRTFTLGQFFDIWGQPLSLTDLLGNRTDASHQIRAYVDGQPYTGNPAGISLAAHTDIVLEYGPPFPTTPAPFVFPAGL